MPKGVLLVLIAFFSILVVLAFIGGFLISKALHEVKGPMVIHTPIIDTALHSKKNHQEDHTPHQKEEKSSDQKEIHQKDAKKKSSQEEIKKPLEKQEPSQELFDENEPLQLPLNNTNPYNLKKYSKRQKDMAVWRTLPYKKIEEDFDPKTIQAPLEINDPSDALALQKIESSQGDSIRMEGIDDTYELDEIAQAV